IYKIVVGDKAESFNIHTSLLCSSSAFFQTSLKKEWEDMRKDSKTIALQHDDPDAFRMYAHWLYCRKFPLADDRDEAYVQLAKAYVLGESLLDAKFKNTILDSIITATTTFDYFPVGQPITIIYEGTPVESPARRLMVDFYVYAMHSGGTSWTRHLGAYPKEFLVDTLTKIPIVRLAPASSGSRPWTKSFENYHEEENNSSKTGLFRAKEEDAGMGVVLVS
ncbi:hypothetical protein P154DRAFT_435014, partial [Amniculicola lignicola CBS 123094]